MDKVEFIKAIQTIEKTAARGFEKLIHNPPGRKPNADLLEISKFYNSLDDNSKIKCMMMANLVSKQTINNLLSIIDGNLSIEDTDFKGYLELYYCKGDTRVRLNTTESATLSEIYRTLE